MREYVEAMPEQNRAVFDRLDALVRRAYPDVEMIMSYRMPTSVVGTARLYVGSWKHGLSLYGWGEGRDGGFAGRHPELRNDKGTIRLTPEAAARLADDDLASLITAALAPGDGVRP